MQKFTQLTGVAAVGAYVLVVSAVCWLLLKALVGLRVGKEEEIEGLDYGEHGNEDGELVALQPHAFPLVPRDRRSASDRIVIPRSAVRQFDVPRACG